MNDLATLVNKCANGNREGSMEKKRATLRVSLHNVLNNVQQSSIYWSIYWHFVFLYQRTNCIFHNDQLSEPQLCVFKIIPTLSCIITIFFLNHAACRCFIRPCIDITKQL